MSVSAIQSQRLFTSLAGGKRINSAADDAAGLAISEKLLAQTNGYAVGTNNAADGMNLMNVADGALSTIQDSLQRIRELAVQAGNGIYSSSDKELIQMEIDGLKQSVQDAARGTEFNTMKLLDGSMADLSLATNPSGGGLKIQMENSTLDSLGIADFNVTGKFSLDSIDNAIKAVSKARSRLGAKTNALGHTINYNENAGLNLMAANSRIRDTDYGLAVTNKNREDILSRYRIFAMKAQMNNHAGVLKLLG
ncbi:MAG: flagellin [Lachnospiraceae bacterium]|nr:flagellin [Lachnospiraceae bacterium]